MAARKVVGRRALQAFTMPAGLARFMCLYAFVQYSDGKHHRAAAHHTCDDAAH